MKRYEDWLPRLNYFIDISSNREFSWGSFDCCLFVCDGIYVLTGEDVAKSFRGNYSTESGAVVQLKLHSGGSVAETTEVITKKFKMLEWSTVHLAQTGDLVLLTDGPFAWNDFNGALGIVLGQNIAVLTLEGLTFLPVSAANKAWRV